MPGLKGKVAIVTGASRGIGASIAVKMAEAGAAVVINYVGSKTTATKIVEQIMSGGGEAMAIQADVSKAGQVKELFDIAIETYGKVDILVNNAGILITKQIKDTSDEEFTRLFEVNVRGSFNTMREAATRLANNGSIINFSTSVSRLIMPGYGLYVATKAAVEQLTRVFAKEMGSRGIRVNVISPGPVNTELFTTGKSEEAIARLAALSAFNRIGEPGDIAEVIVFLSSDESKWISAQNIGVNGGMA